MKNLIIAILVVTPGAFAESNRHDSTDVRSSRPMVSRGQAAGELIGGAFVYGISHDLSGLAQIEKTSKELISAQESLERTAAIPLKKNVDAQIRALTGEFDSLNDIRSDLYWKRRIQIEDEIEKLNKGASFIDGAARKSSLSVRRKTVSDAQDKWLSQFRRYSGKSFKNTAKITVTRLGKITGIYMMVDGVQNLIVAFTTKSDPSESP